MAAAAGDPPLLPSAPVRLDLPGIRAALAPTLGAWPSSSTTQAAVSLVLREPLEHRAASTSLPGAELLLIRRAEQVGDPWSGHMALPGGRCDPTDGSILHTAERETREEVGLALERSGLPIGRLPAIQAVAAGKPVGLTVVPLVFQLTEPVELRFNHEVAEALWVPLEDLHGGALNTYVDYPLHSARAASGERTLAGRGPGPRGVSARLPAWAIRGRIVWGLTHRMISTLLDLLDQRASPGAPLR